MTKNLLAIEIGMFNMKIAVLQQTKDHYTVLRYEIVRLSEKAYDLDGFLVINEVKPELELALNKLKAQKMATSLVINSSKKIVRTRDLPLAGLKELEGIVKYEAEQFLPYGIDQFYIDFKVIGSGVLTIDQQDKEKQTIDGAKVMIAALPKEIMDPYMALCNEVNLKLVSVTLHTEAVHTFVKHHFLDKSSAVVVCDIGYGSTNTILFENKEFLADISTESGLLTVSSHFALKYGVDEKRCLDVLFGKLDFKLEKTETEVDQLYKKIERLNQFVASDVTPTPETEDSAIESAYNALGLLNGQEKGSAIGETSYMASNIIQENKSELYGDLLKEISRMLEFYRTRRFGARVDRIYICGGGAKLVGLLGFLKERLDTNAIYMISKECQISGMDIDDIDLMVPAIGGAIGR